MSHTNVVIVAHLVNLDLVTLPSWRTALSLSLRSCIWTIFFSSFLLSAHLFSSPCLPPPALLCLSLVVCCRGGMVTMHAGVYTDQGLHECPSLLHSLVFSLPKRLPAGPKGSERRPLLQKDTERHKHVGAHVTRLCWLARGPVCKESTLFFVLFCRLSSFFPSSDPQIEEYIVWLTNLSI